MKVFYVMKSCLLLLFLFAAVTVQAQTGTLSGKVLDETGQGLPGASVQIKSLNKSTSTDPDGNFRITGLANGAVTITVSYIGYTPFDQAVTISGNTTTNINLKPDAQNLNEVVVIGYGTAEKKNLTGSIPKRYSYYT